MRLLKMFASNQENCIVTASRLLDLLSIPVTRSSLQKDLSEHPDYPSLLSISDVLSSYSVESIAIKANSDKMERLPLPALAQLKGIQGGPHVFTVIKSIIGKQVVCLSPEKDKWIKLEMGEFISRWTGIVLLVEASPEAGEKEFLTKKREEARRDMGLLLTLLAIPFIAFIAIIAAFFSNGKLAVFPSVYLFINLIGAFTTLLLLQYELGQHNPMLQQICGAGKKTSCNTILSSKASKLAGISWSVIGFSYFMGGMLGLLSTGVIHLPTLFLVSWINVLALPYTGFSIYYQWRVARQWCPLCLTVQALLILQFITAFAGGWHFAFLVEVLPISTVIAVALAFLLPLLVAGIMLPALRNAKESRSNKTALQRLKHNPQIFNALLEKQKALTELPAGLGIVLGNPSARYKIIKVCNPYCGPCAKAHDPMEELLHNNPDIQVQIIFTATNDNDDIKAPPVKHLLAIAEKGDDSQIKRALGDWYLADQKDYNQFSSKYPMNGELQKQGSKIEAMRQWCDKTDIQFTPTFFVNGYQLPEMYSVKDLKYFLSV